MNDIKVFGQVEENAILQLMNSMIEGAKAVMNADGHFGYSFPVGGVFAHPYMIPVEGAGYDLGCVDSETEFLSPNGWVKLSEYNGENVCVFNHETDEGYFEKPIAYLKLKTGEGFYHLKSRNMDQAISADHTVLLYKPQTYKPFTMLAKDFVKQHDSSEKGCYYKFNTSFTLKTEHKLPYTDEELKFMVMVCADGHITNKNTNRCQVSVKKQRKIDRAIKILEDVKIPYIMSKITTKGYVNFSFTSALSSKKFTKLWGASLEQLKIIADEALYWDGNPDEKAFFTRDKENADFINYAFTAIGLRSYIHVDYRDSGIDYRVFGFKDTKYISLKTKPENSNVQIIPNADGYKYCFTVSTGFFVTRRNGKVIITGNCGNSAVKLNLKRHEIGINDLMNWIGKNISFGIGRNSTIPLTDEQFQIIYEIKKSHIPQISKLAQLAEGQLGTIGSGNHYVDIFTDENGYIWIGNHFGSRGFGHKVATMFMLWAQGKSEGDKLSNDSNALPNFINMNSTLGQDYAHAIHLAGEYARIGRKTVIENITNYLGATVLTSVNNHHNYVWQEMVGNELMWVVRKGATPNHIGVQSFVGSNMRDYSYILEGQDTQTNEEALHSTAHGAGRIMSRMEAKGKTKRIQQEDGSYITRIVKEGKVNWQDVQAEVGQYVVLVGGGPDEAPNCYKKLDEVLGYMGDSIKIIHKLKPIGVAMAGANEFDPYKD